MGLKTSYGSSNRVVDSALVVTYSRSPVSMDDYEFRRRARKSYRYVGMTESAARSCQIAMVALYTRAYKVSLRTVTGGWLDSDAGSVCMAEVAMNHNEDGSYDVVVNVNEDDVRHRLTPSDWNASTAFSAERQRGYDGETETIPQTNSQSS